MTRTICGRCEMDECQCKPTGATAMTNEELDILWFKAMRQSAEGDKALGHYHFAALVAAAEREACAKACEKLIDTFSSSQYKTGQPWSSIGERFAVSSCAAAIRARGEK